MPEKINNIQVFSLLEVTNSIKKTITERYKSSFWVKAEMSKLNYYPHSGHCYPDLIQKHDGKLLASIKANLWKEDYQRINNEFKKILGEPLKDNITILLNAKIIYEPLHGLTLRIINIDSSYARGELEREKLEAIERLRKEGIFNNNKQLILPILPKRIAVVSVETSKGYADFLDVINSNASNYNFFCMLFPSLLQGENAVGSIINQLNRIQSIKDHFDLVAIIRGGGGDVGLSCYNNYQLAKKIALYPLPVLTGIGHSTNETVVEMISNQNSITPTKLAEFLIERFHNFSKSVIESERIICEVSRKIVEDEKLKIKNSIRLFNSVSKNHLLKNKEIIHNEIKNLKDKCKELNINAIRIINNYASNVSQNVKYQILQGRNQNEQILLKIKNGKNNYLNKSLSKIKDLKNRFIRQCPIILQNKNKEIENINKDIDLLNPRNVLRRGYSITYVNGKSIKTYSEVKANSEVNTVLFEGSFKSIITTIKKDNLL